MLRSLASPGVTASSRASTTTVNRRRPDRSGRPGLPGTTSSSRSGSAADAARADLGSGPVGSAAAGGLQLGEQVRGGGSHRGDVRANRLQILGHVAVAQVAHGGLQALHRRLHGTYLRLVVILGGRAERGQVGLNLIDGGLDRAGAAQKEAGIGQRSDRRLELVTGLADPVSYT